MTRQTNQLINELQKAYLQHLVDMYMFFELSIDDRNTYLDHVNDTITEGDEAKLFMIFESVVGVEGNKMTAMETMILMNVMKDYVTLVGGDFSMEDLTFKSLAKWISYAIGANIPFEVFMQKINNE